MTTFDEAARIALYSEHQLDWLASSGAALRDASEADPAAMLASAFALAWRRDPITRAMVSDVVTYLPGDLLVKVDLASMAHSLECRGPFLDHRVVELAMAMPIDRKIRFRQGRSKVILKQAFAELLPPPIKTRSKMGFGVPHQPMVPKRAERTSFGTVLLDPICSESRNVPPAGNREAGRRAHRRQARALAPTLGAADARIVVPRVHGYVR